MYEINNPVIQIVFERYYIVAWKDFFVFKTWFIRKDSYSSSQAHNGCLFVRMHVLRMYAWEFFQRSDSC